MRRMAPSLLLAASLSSAFVNITVDDTDTSLISYGSDNCRTLQPDDAERSWQVPSGKFVDSCHNQTLRRCEGAGASISFKFTGVAVYVLYPPWPHDMKLSATLDSNPPIFLTLPVQSDGTLHSDAEYSSPVWGLSGLADTDHTLTIGRPDDGSLYVDAFMYTARQGDTPLRRRRRGETEPGHTSGDDNIPVAGSSAPGSSSSSTGSSTSSVPSLSAILSSSSAILSSSSAIPSPSTIPSSSPSTSAPPQTTVISQIASSRDDTVVIILGVVLALFGIAMATVSCFFYHRFRRRTRAPDPEAYRRKPSPSPNTVSYVSTEVTIPPRPPSMRERSDLFSYTHTRAGTPLTRSPVTTFATWLPPNSMRLAHSHLYSSSGGGTSLRALPETSHGGDSEAPLEIPPPGYET
ncbi:hypothetical protein C8R45DRAFT_1088788 [Mycena sanguinolenta]|nr:hypothetical protein C8R45DRAFT_1088788 [Mycena sanguinolenta]